ncbi:hypothetical protein GCM10008018_46620 [Paenibacillus marchantiophytorum]|uniref:DUF2399 domain-containing protein n=1 Tax=Paenibacillus marchantiophytorum TaxID=1619310 RepID=A0ABQ1F0B4_9BACL|nr:DUF2399 domain-containing protein [Paenibacillus marchantiophytorum]GFZ94870.1 hypothetical protein GCM10008018_46620 [Paenibacillus marchantiophytorum]
MNIDVRYGLPFIEVTICYRGEKLHLNNVLLDTGSAGTIFSANAVDAAPALAPVRHIYVVENPAVFSTLADAADKLPFAGDIEGHDTIGPLLMCTSGPASAAALRLYRSLMMRNFA